MDGRIEALEDRIDNLERKNRLQTAFILAMIGAFVLVGCRKGQTGEYLSEDGKSRLIVSAEGLVFKDGDGNTKGEVTSSSIRLQGPSSRTVIVGADSVDAGLTVLENGDHRLTFRADSDEARMIIHDTTNSRRATLTTDKTGADFRINGPQDENSVALICREGRALVVKSPP